MTTFNTCRFCKDHMRHNGDLIKYGTRHYAHPICYLESGKPLSNLSKHELGKLPYFEIKRRGLIAEVERLTA